MKTLRTNTFLRLFAILLFSITILSSCAEDLSGPGDGETAPELPPENTMLMNFDFLANPAPAELPAGKTRAHLNWAALNVGIWNTILVVTLVGPVAAFGESFNHDPVRQEDGSWLWSYNFPVLGVQHSAKLYGRLESNQIQWEMFVSRDGAFTDRLWFYGQSDLLITEGTWTLNDPNRAVETSFLFIEWQRDLQSEDASVKYTNVLDGNAGKGSYIEYGRLTNGDFELFYDIYNAETGNQTDIEWDRNPTVTAGRVADENRFGDTNWRCWDSQGEDITCP
ncbi:MAG: hypothetical protein ACRBF0_14480 [Calditrichia bacterium]